MTRKIVMMFLILIVGIALVGCDSAGAGGDDADSSQDSTDDADAPQDGANDDPTDLSDAEVIEEFTNPEPIANDGGSTYTYWIRDRDTEEPIVSDVTIVVTNGTAPPLNSDGSFTLTQDQGPFRVSVPGYDVYNRTDVQNGKNIVYKQELYPDMIGEWILFGVTDNGGPPTEATPVDYDERVEFGSDGIERWSGDRVNSEGYYSTFTMDGGERRYARTRGEHNWIYIGGAPPHEGFGDFLRHFVWFDEEEELLQRVVGKWYSRDGENPYGSAGDGNDGGSGISSGTVSFNGENQSITSASRSGGTWGISTSSYVIAVSNAPSSGSVNVDSSYYTGNLSAVGVQVSDFGGNIWIADSGTITVSGSTIQIRTSMMDIYDVAFGGGGATFSLSVSAEAQ